MKTIEVVVCEMQSALDMYNRIAELKREICIFTASMSNPKVSRVQKILMPSRIAQRKSELKTLQLTAAIIEKDGGVYTDDGDFIAL